MIGHADESGAPCTRHVPAEDKLLAFASVGSRVSGFHHDAASKLQSLVMALDELDELIGGEPSDVRTATETAQTAVRQLHALLTMNRALAKPPQPTRSPLPDVLKRAAERYAVKLRGELPAYEIMAAPPSVIHVLSMLLDMIAGPHGQGRTVEVNGTSDGARVILTLDGNVEATHQHLNELIEIAAYMLAREHGVLRCGAQRFVVELPVAQ
jgi:hypothetical protein